jgi:hypothetical protein
VVSNFKLVVSAVLAMAVADTSVAQDPIMPGFIAGNRLIEACTSAVEHDNALCFGYVVGVSDAMQAAQATGGALRCLAGKRACLPALLPNR